MNHSETFWLTILIQILKAFIVVAVILFATIPRKGKIAYIELGLMLWVSLIAESCGFVAVYIVHSNPNIYGNIYTMVILPLGVIFYWRRVNWKYKNIIAALLIISSVGFTLSNLLINGFYDFNSYCEALVSFYFIAMSVAYFYKLLHEMPTESITKLPMFWINTAFLMYYSGAFVIELSADYLITVLGSDMINPLSVIVFLDLIFYSILWYAMLLIKRLKWTLPG